MNQANTDAIFDVAGKGLTAIAISIGGGLVVNLKDPVFDSFPAVDVVIGVFIALAGLVLYWQLVAQATLRVEQYYKSKIAAALVAGFMVVIALTFFFASVQAASNSQQCASADRSTATRFRVG